MPVIFSPVTAQRRNSKAPCTTACLENIIVAQVLNNISIGLSLWKENFINTIPIYVRVMFSSNPKSSKPSSFSNASVKRFSAHPLSYTFHSSHLILLDFIALSICSEE
jgi:hypothetical protein